MYRPSAQGRKTLSATLDLPPLPESKARILMQAWEALLGVVAALGATRVSWGSVRDNHLRVGLSRIASWMLRVASHSGVGYLVSNLKKVAGEARSCAVCGVAPGPNLRFFLRCLPWGSVKALEQLSYLGRALPEGDEVVARANLFAHRDTLREPFSTPTDILNFSREYARKFAASRCEPVEPFLPSAPSASVGCSRRSGGTREVVRTQWKEWLDKTDTFIPELDALIHQNQVETSLEGGVPDPAMGGQDVSWSEETMTALSNLCSVPVAESAARLSAGPLQHRVCCVPERGWKQRIVSAPPAYASVAGTVLNKALLRALRKEGRCRSFLVGDRRMAIERAMSAWFPGCLIVSTDLSSASDRLPLDLVEAVVNGLVDGWKGLSPTWADALRSLTGPQLLQYPWGQVINSERGILMGLGPTWPILSLIHLIWVDYSASLVGARRSAWKGTSFGGDDLIAAWPPRLYEKYSETVRACGGQFSPGKMFVHPTGGNFTEITFWVNPENSAIRWASGVPLKGLVGTTFFKEGEAFESVHPDGGRRQAARRVLRALRPDAWRKSRESGNPPCFPRSLGGSGLPPLRGGVNRVHAPRWLRLAVGRFLYGTNDVQPLGPPSWGLTKDPVALAARRRAEVAFSNGLAFGIIAVTRDPSNFDLEPIGLVEDVVGKETALFASAAAFQLRPLPPSASGMARPRAHARSLRAWSRRTLRGGVPDRMAVREGGPSRDRLLARARLIRSRWVVVPLIEGLWPFDPG